MACGLVDLLIHNSMFNANVCSFELIFQHIFPSIIRFRFDLFFQSKKNKYTDKYAHTYAAQYSYYFAFHHIEWRKNLAIGDRMLLLNSLNNRTKIEMELKWFDELVWEKSVSGMLYRSLVIFVYLMNFIGA